MNPFDGSSVDFGHLISVVGLVEFLPTEMDLPVRYDEYEFAFERGKMVVTAIAEDDTISLSLDGATLPHAFDLSRVAPWDRLVGCDIRWVWLLTNDRGYTDGFQIELGRPGECWAIQLMCGGSALSARAIAPLDQLWNEFG